ncbi:MAG: hypothetical protein GC184_13400 [Rhizobiales bacterium]|nr:hypothetical protein [Hyphomicrobiales bacterium]
MWNVKIFGSLLLVAALGGCQVTGSTSSKSLMEMGPDGNLVMVKSGVDMPVGQQVVPPVGYIGFCLRNKADCAGGSDQPSNIAMTPERWSQLNEVNEYVNRNIPQVEDEELYHRAEWWAYADARGGDCEDLALLKQKMLVERGWPADSLLLAVVREWNGDGHAVLIAKTANGEYVLDNKNWAIVAWQDAPYTWIKRQSRERPYIWVNLDERSFRQLAAAPLPPVGTVAPFVTAALGASATDNPVSLAELRPAQLAGDTSSLRE